MTRSCNLQLPKAAYFHPHTGEQYPGLMKYTITQNCPRLFPSPTLTPFSEPQASARNVLLKHLRVQVQAVPSNPSSTAPLFLSPFAAIRRRLLSEEVRGTFLDKSEVTDRVVSVVKNFQKVDPSKVTPNANFESDLGLDSLDSVEIVMALEEEFGFEIPDNEADKIKSIDLAVDFISSHPQAK